MPVALAALSKGAHLRVGMEDVLTISRGVPVDSNVQLVERVVLSDDMRRAVLARHAGLESRIVVLTNFELPDYEAPDSPVASPLAADVDRLRIVFTGNIGRFQGLETITRAVLDPSPALAGIQLVFMGEGAAKTELQHIVAQSTPESRARVTFLGHGSSTSARALLDTADLGLVSLAPEVIRYAYPSKTANYLGAGLPILVAVEPESSLARVVNSASVGGCCRFTMWSRPSAPSKAGSVAVPSSRRCRSTPQHSGPRTTPGRNSCLAGSSSSPAFRARIRSRSWTPHEPGSRRRHRGGSALGHQHASGRAQSLPGYATWPCDEINLVWRHGNRAHPSDELGPGLATEPVRAYIRDRFGDIRRRYGARSVVEKTCANSLRVEFVREVMPDARYVFITRDGLDAAPSAMERWHAPLDLRYTAAKTRFVPPGDLPYYGRRFVAARLRRRSEDPGQVTGWWGPRTDDAAEMMATRPLDEICLLQWSRCVENSRRGLMSLPDDQLHLVSYEQFVRNPKDGLRSLLDFLHRPEVFDPSAVSGVSASSIGKGRASLSAEARRRLTDLGRPTLEGLGYALD